MDTKKVNAIVKEQIFISFYYHNKTINEISEELNLASVTVSAAIKERLARLLPKKKTRHPGTLLMLKKMKCNIWYKLHDYREPYKKQLIELIDEQALFPKSTILYNDDYTEFKICDYVSWKTIETKIREQ